MIKLLNEARSHDIALAGTRVMEQWETHEMELYFISVTQCRNQLQRMLLWFVMLFKDALINMMVRRLPTTPPTPTLVKHLNLPTPSIRCTERGLLLLEGF